MRNSCFGGRATVVTPKAPLDCTAVTRDGAGTINQKELSKHCSAAAREAGSDAADNESRRDADIEAELLTRLSIFRQLPELQTAQRR